MYLYLLAIARGVFILYLPQYCNYIHVIRGRMGRQLRQSLSLFSLSLLDDVNVDKYNMVMSCGAMQGSFLCTIPHDMYWPGNIRRTLLSLNKVKNSMMVQRFHCRRIVFIFFIIPVFFFFFTTFDHLISVTI